MEGNEYTTFFEQLKTEKCKWCGELNEVFSDKASTFALSTNEMDSDVNDDSLEELVASDDNIYHGSDDCNKQSEDNDISSITHKFSSIECDSGDE